MSAPEIRAGTEFRVSGRTLSGVVMRYGDISPEHAERFLPGAFAPVPAVPMRLQHDPAMEILPAGSFVLADGDRALEVRAELPPDSAALRLVQRGALAGWSVGFHARQERAEAGIRVVERASLVEVSLVDAGAYPAAKAEVRARSGRTMRARIPSDTELDCECVGAGCKVKFLQDALAQAIQQGIDEGLALAAHGNYKRPLASASKGTVRARMIDGDAEVEIDIPDSDAGREVLAAAADAGVVVRPFIDRENAEFKTDAGGVTVYSKSPIRAFIVSATDKREGWPDPVLVPTPGMDPEGRAALRRWLLWL